MFRVSDTERSEARELCRRYGVSRLDLFGSATGELFDDASSDLDFMVSFEGTSGLFDRYFGLREDLGRLFGRGVDLVMEGAVKNPNFKRSADETWTPLYAA